MSAAIEIDPDRYLRLLVGEKEAYELDMADYLDGDTVSTYPMTITDSDGNDVTSNFTGGTSESSGVLTFGLIGYAAGTYTVTIWITCAETLPDGSTARKFKVRFVLVVQ